MDDNPNQNKMEDTERKSFSSTIWVGSILLCVFVIGVIAIFVFDNLSKSSTPPLSTIDENNVTVLKDISSITIGKNIFQLRCSPCHGLNGEGLQGPNLTDDYWIHGCDVKSIFTTVKYGVPIKGMLAWDGILTPQEMQQVVSYVISIRGTKPPNGKAPEGTLCIPKDTINTKSDSTKNKSDSTGKNKN